MTKDQTAPGRLDRVRQFLNTVDFEKPGGEDKLSGSEAPVWLTAFGYDGSSVEAGQLEQLRAFREAIRAVLLAHNGDGDDREAWQSFVALASGRHVVVRFDELDRCSLRASSARTVDALRDELVGIIYDAVRDGTWRRLKACRKDTCLWAFYDHSKNVSGSWCSMAVCGNRAKAQRRRTKQRA